MACLTEVKPGTRLAMLPGCAVWFDGGLTSIYQVISLTSHTQPIYFRKKYLHKKGTDLGKSYHMEL